jgi:hypothetical protein
VSVRENSRGLPPVLDIVKVFVVVLLGIKVTTGISDGLMLVFGGVSVVVYGTLDKEEVFPALSVDLIAK